MTTQEINFDDYLSDETKEEIVSEVFRSKCHDMMSNSNSAERVFINAAHNTVYKMVDEQYDGDVGERITKQVIEKIDTISEHDLIRRPNAWDKWESQGAKAFDKAINNNKDKINKRVVDLIDSAEIPWFREVIKDCVMEYIEESLFKNKESE